MESIHYKKKVNLEETLSPLKMNIWRILIEVCNT